MKLFHTYRLIACCFITLNAVLSAKNLLSSVNNFQHEASQDIEFIFNLLKNNHPGWIDKENPGFKQWCVDGYRQAQREATTVDSAITCNACIQKYCNGFQDPHLYCIYANEPKDYYWPGFITEFNNNKFIVSTSLIDKVPVGAEIIKCDDTTPQEYLTKYIFPYFGNPNLTASWHTKAYLLTAWNTYPHIPKIRNYTLIQDGKKIVYTPEWEPIEKALLDFKSGPCQLREKMETSLFSIDKNILWLQLPSFFPTTKEEETKLHSIIKLLAGDHDYPIITFDLRGNGGGSSAWCTGILKALWGTDVYKHAIDALYDQQYSQWRVSKNNLEYLQSLLPKFKEEFSDNLLKWLTKNIAGMQKALDNNQEYYTERPTQDYDGNYIQQTNPAIAIVIDSYCDSVCLDFIDELTNFAHCTLFGQDTNADTNYVEARDVVLPSKNATLTFPIKVLRERKRAYNQAYRPDIYIEDICNTDVGQKIVKKHMLGKITRK